MQTKNQHYYDYYDYFNSSYSNGKNVTTDLTPSDSRLNIERIN